jgi:FkbM family methyltransferase
MTVGGMSADFIAQNRTSIAKTQARIDAERDELTEVIGELNSDDVFYDVGANTGLYTRFAAERCSHVVAFEPSPPNLSELKRNAALGPGEVTVVTVALSDTSGTVRLNTPTDATPGHGTASITENRGRIVVGTARGDDMIESVTIPPPNVVKIDVEGAEEAVVRGLKDALADSRCRLVYCEIHKSEWSGAASRDTTTASAVAGQLESMGFEIKRFDREGDRFVLRARRGD